MSVGAALRRRRNELGMTLRELADEAELTSGFLSQVENDRVSPSLKRSEEHTSELQSQ